MPRPHEPAFPCPAFYPIIDVPLVRPDRALALADALSSVGPLWIQLRGKALGAKALLDLARTLVARVAAAGARIIVNDRVDVALAAGASGVHLGEEDLPIEAARKVVGPGFVIGVSTHSVGEARRAEKAGADYIGFGPMFATTSKADALTPRSLDDLSAVRAAVHLPIVAIGGITEARAQGLLDAGADAVAMIGALASSDDPAALASRLVALRGRR